MTGIQLSEHLVLVDKNGDVVASVPWSNFTVTAPTQEEARLAFGRAYLELCAKNQDERDALAAAIAERAG